MRMNVIHFALASCAAIAFPGVAFAAQSDPAPTATSATSGGDDGEIVITARKRQESILKVPVIAAVVSQKTMENYQIADVGRLATRVPGLVLGSAPLAIGPQVSIRGVGTSTLDAGVDQSTSLNIDGLSMSQGVAFRAGLFDLAQVEVLKGPQALFYGKNSPAGVISIRTADPGDKLEVIARAGYEFEAREKRGELILSTPLGETLGIRIAGMASDMDGFFRNKATAAPGLGGLPPTHDRAQDTKSYIVRGTLVWKPDPVFDARLKVNYTSDSIKGDASQSQLVSCPDGAGATAPSNVQFIHPNDDCHYDRDYYITYFDPAFFPGVENGGVPFLKLRQKFGTLELNYRPENLTVTSVTGYYRNDTDSLLNASQAGYAGTPFSQANDLRRTDFTQELRVDSSFSGPLNFTAGAFYQDGRLRNTINRVNSTLFPALLGAGKGTHVIDIKSYSAFGQLRWRPVEQVEIAGGVRYTDEKRSDTLTRLTPIAAAGPVALANPNIRSKNWSPEFTITYTPTDDLTVFGSLKQGYKSGSFTITAVNGPGSDNSFGDEKVQGGEIGIKGRLADRALRYNLAGYYYKYKGLQVGINTDGPNNTTLIRTLNAGGAEVYGVDFDMSYRPPSVQGLTINGAINWNHAEFTKLNNVPCYGGQLVTEGCDERLNPATGRFTSQDLSGLPLIRAPRWQLQAGFDYEMPVGGDMKLNLGADAQYSSKYTTGLSRRQDIVQKGFATLNANVALSGRDDAWEIALIGNNITNKLTYSSCNISGTAAGVVFGSSISGGTTRGAGGLDEATCQMRRGREAWVRLTLRPAGFLGGN
jgi:iron complex outermembrane receptor protein